jgi:hypothetical protein
MSHFSSYITTVFFACDAVRCRFLLIIESPTSYEAMTTIPQPLDHFSTLFDIWLMHTYKDRVYTINFGLRCSVCEVVEGRVLMRFL